MIGCFCIGFIPKRKGGAAADGPVVKPDAEQAKPAAEVERVGDQV
jgi:hypothetical protein